MKTIILTVCLLFIFSCEKEDNNNKVQGRWYTVSQVEKGKKVYQQNCIMCHLPNGAGTTNWKEKLPDGSYPPPPLDGSAHAWHHSFDALMETVNKGGAEFGGKMPPFGDKLNPEEKEAVIAYIQSLWQDDIYKHWEEKINIKQEPKFR